MSVHISNCYGVKFSREYNFKDFGFFEFCGNKFSRIWILNFTPLKNFPRISCAVLESEKSGSHMVVFVTLFTTNFIMTFSNVKKRSSFFAIYFLAGVCFHGI